jgi:hypothetical protein
MYISKEENKKRKLFSLIQLMIAANARRTLGCGCVLVGYDHS